MSAAGLSSPSRRRRRIAYRASRDFSTIVDLLNMLGHLDGPVLDHTGVSGKFDFDFWWSPALDQFPVEPGRPGPEAFGVPIFTALQTELGLKLEPHNGPVDILIIDHAEKPAPN